MANNQSIQFLRGTAARKAEVGSSTTLLAGQPFFETDTNRLYIGDGSKTLSTLSAISAYYDTVISTQEGFEAWYTQLDAGTYTGSSVLLLDGEYTRSDGKGITLPDNVKQLHGTCNVKITVSNLPESTDDSTTFAVGYSEVPADRESYSIKNIQLHSEGVRVPIPSTSITVPTTAIGFYQCVGLMNCSCSVPSFSPQGLPLRSFYKCVNVINCISPSGDSAEDLQYFYECANLTSCEGSSFTSCTQLTSCEGSSFTSCTQLTSCEGSSFTSCTQLTSCEGSSFTSCTQLTSCEGSSNISECADLVNCKLSGQFKNCTNLTNCQAERANRTFLSCTNLTNCKGSAHSTGGGTETNGFESCTNLSNCIGSGHGEDGSYMAGRGYAFYNCSGCTNCRQDPDITSRWGTWGGTNTNVDPNTCPEYKA